MHLRGLHRQKLGVAASFRLVALNREIGIHRIIADHRAQKIIGSGIDRHQIADLDPPLRPRFAAERRDQRDAA